jgi:hypothetical protein
MNTTSESERAEIIREYVAWRRECERAGWQYPPPERCDQDRIDRAYAEAYAAMVAIGEQPDGPVPDVELEAELEEAELEEPVAERERCGGYENLNTLTGGCGDCPDCDAGERHYDELEERGRGPD